jgi:hypothetical protein
MAWLKRICVAIGVLAITGGLSYLGLKKYAETYSFSSESPEQERLADEHARCAGYYMVLHAALNKESPDYPELEANYSGEFEHHTKMGFHFSPDKAKFKSQIETAAAEFQTQVIGAAEKEKVVAIVDSRMNECFATSFRSSDFVQRTLQRRADH